MENKFESLFTHIHHVLRTASLPFKNKNDYDFRYASISALEQSMRFWEKSPLNVGRSQGEAKRASDNFSSFLSFISGWTQIAASASIGGFLALDVLCF